MAELNDDLNFKTISLSQPITLGEGKSLTSVKMSRRFKVKHMKMIPKSFMEYAAEKDDKKKKKINIDLFALIPLLAALCNLPEETFDEIDFDDLMNISKELESFFPKTP